MTVRPLRPWGPLAILSLSVIVLAGVIAPPARGQSTSQALWTAGAGVWSNQNNWDCSGPPFPPGNAGPCVPNGANYGVSIPVSSQVSLDIGATVNSINMGGATLTISGTSLTAPLIFGGTLILSSHGQDQGGFSGDSLSLDKGSQMNGGSGAIGVSGPVTLSNGSQITGTTVSGSSVTLSGGSSIDSTNGFTGGSGTLSGGSQWNGLSGASGTFTMTGNSTVTGFGDFQGTLNISGGSEVTVTDNGANFGVAGMQLHGSNVIDGSKVIYETQESQGVITVFGSLVLQNGAHITQGESEMTAPVVDVAGAAGASLKVTNNSTLIASSAIIGASFNGSATIENDSKWTIQGPLTVVNGVLQISSVSTVTDASAIVGDFGSGHGQVVVSSSGSTWNTGALIVGELGSVGEVDVLEGTLAISGPTQLTVGNQGKGTLNVLNGGDVISFSAVIAAQPGAQGTVNVNGQGSTWRNVATVDVGLGGEGTLSVSNGGEVLATQINVDSHGTLNGTNGTIFANVVVNRGGTVAPGDPGPMNIIGNVNFQTGSMLDLQIGGTGAGQFDQLNITGNGVFDGTIDLDFINGFTPAPGNTFDLINVSGSANFSGDTVNVLGLPPGFEFTESFANGEFVLTEENGGGGGIPTPEPATWVLLGTGIAVILLLRGHTSKRVAMLS
jgi:T5SS/PEP-CTERM-associated repeat protein